MQHIAGLAVVAAALAFAPARSLAQAPPAANGATTNTNLLQPSLQGNPNNPPRFRRPGEGANAGDQPPPVGAFTANSRIGATPVYGSPNAFGAGDTGFDSTNARKRKKKSPPPPAPGSTMAPPQPETTFAPVPNLTPPPPPKPPAGKKPPPPAEVHPAKAAARPGATLAPPPEQAPVNNPPPELHPATAATRHGGALPVPLGEADIYGNVPAPPPSLPPVPLATPAPTAPVPSTLPLGMQPVRPLPIGEGDPYAALGIRAGSFVLLPSLDLSGAYNTNPEHAGGGPNAAAYFVGGPELQVASDWSRHSLTADITGTYTQYADGNLVPSLNVPYFNSRIDGRVDVSRDTQIILENRFLLTTDNPGSPNLQFGLAKLPIDTDLGGTLGVVQQFSRLSVAVLATFDRAVYYPSLLTDGEQDTNADRNFNQTAGILRVGYELSPDFKPFVQVQEDERIYDWAYDSGGLQRNSTGTTALAGADVNMFGSLTGEMAGGWVIRNYKDPTLPDISGAIASGALIWQPTALTTAKLGASSQVYETTLAGASGQFTHDVTLEVDHAFLRWLTATGTVGHGTDNYVGSTLRDDRYFVAAGLIYKMSREVQVRAQVRQDWQLATQPGFSYMATSFLLGLHLQR